MSERIEELFTDQAIITKVQNKLPLMFQMAERELSRHGKAGMETGTLREKIITALLTYKFGESNVDLEIPIIATEVDVKLFGQSFSIKTKTTKSPNPGQFKLIWTVDKQKALEFRNTYSPSCGLILAHIFWGKTGGLYYIPLAVQSELLQSIGREKYIKLPKEKTNPRGVEISSHAVKQLLADSRIRKIPIKWIRQEIDYNPYERWLELWQED